MFTLLRNGSPTPACKQCRRFFDDDRGHSPGCRFGPTGVAMPEHHWGYALVVKKPHETLTGAPDTFEKCPRKWAYPQSETALDKLNAPLILEAHKEAIQALERWDTKGSEDPVLWEAYKKALVEWDTKVNPDTILWDAYKQAREVTDLKVTPDDCLWHEFQHCGAVYCALPNDGLAYKKSGRNYTVHKFVVNASRDLVMSPPLRVETTEQAAITFIEGHARYLRKLKR